MSSQATFAARVSTTPSDFLHLLRSAWLDVRFNLHPMLAAISSAPADLMDLSGYAVHYPLVDASSALDWAVETVVANKPSTMLELVDSLLSTSPTAHGSRGHLHFAPSPENPGRVFHLTLVVGHWVTDGLGGLRILNRVLENLNTASQKEYSWGDEVSRLSVPLAIATGLRVIRNGEIGLLPPAQVDNLLEGMSQAMSAVEPRFTKAPGEYAIPRPTRHVTEELCLSLSDSGALLAVCREHGVTITSLLNVLLLMAFVQTASALEGIKTVEMPAFSANRSDDLLEIYKGSVGLNIVFAPLSINARSLAACLNPTEHRTAEIWAAARALRDQMVQLTVSFVV
jgi:hypothetical protein